MFGEPAHDRRRRFAGDFAMDDAVRLEPAQRLGESLFERWPGRPDYRRPTLCLISAQWSNSPVRVFGKEVRDLTARERALIGYVAEGQRLPWWMTLRQLEAYLAPLYDSWDAALADALRE